MDTPHEIVHAFMVDSVMLPDASENLRKESFPITTLRTPIEDDILDIRMERSENNPKMFPNTSFFPKVMQPSYCSKGTRELPCSFMALYVSS